MSDQPLPTDVPGIFRCPDCGLQNPRPIEKPFRHNCGTANPPPDLTPLLTRLAELTGHPEIIDYPYIYGRAVQQWAAESFETRDDDEVEFCEGLCRENVCGKHQGGLCRPSCGPGMIVAVKARMASEGCPWRFNRW